jgi:hypothetical protein
VTQRVRNLQTGSIDKLVLLALYKGNVERKLHRQFAKSRLRKGSEYFHPTAELLKLFQQLKQVNSDLTELDRLYLAELCSR